MAGIFTTQPILILTKQDQDPHYIQNPQIGNDSMTLQNQIKFILDVLRRPLPQPQSVIITDPSGNKIAWLGYESVNGIIYQSLWAKQAYFGGSDPITATVVVNGTQIKLTGSGVAVTIDSTIPIISMHGGNGSLFLQPGVVNVVGVVAGQSVLIDGNLGKVTARNLFNAQARDGITKNINPSTTTSMIITGGLITGTTP